MIPHKLYIALEGASCAGKTTLAQALAKNTRQDLLHVPDYCDLVGGGRFLPAPVPNGLEEEADALRAFLQLEAKRNQLIASTKASVVLIDRSIHSLAAHCYALDRRGPRSGYSSLARSMLSTSEYAIFPDVILYLDVRAGTATARNALTVPRQAIFMDPEFNVGLRSYFVNVAKSATVRTIWLDANRSLPDIYREAEHHIEALASDSGPLQKSRLTLSAAN